MSKIFGIFTRTKNKKRTTKFLAIILGCAFLILGGSVAYQAVALTGINIISPAGGEYWSGTQLITWDADCEEGDYVNIQYTTGSTFTTIATVACSQKQYEWNTENYPDNLNYQIRIYLDGNLGKNDISNVFVVDNTPPSVESDTLLSPNGGEYLAGGTTVEFDWDPLSISDANLGDSPIALEYYNGEEWVTIATEEANDGSYEWTVPNNVNTESAKVRIIAVDKAGNTASDESDDTFTIDSTNPAVKVITSNGGDKLKGGDDYKITWQANDDHFSYDPITIEYYNGEEWEVIATEEANDGEYDWTVPDDVNTDAAKIRITAVDLAGNSASDESDSTFIIDNTAPNSAATLDDFYGDNESGIVHLSGTASDDNAGIDYVKITITKNGSTYWNGSEWTDEPTYLDADFNEGVWTYDLNTAALSDEETYTITPIAWDQAGNSAVGTADSFTYDSSAPVFEISDGASTDWVSSDSIIFTVDYSVSGNSNIHDYVFIDDESCNSSVDFSEATGFEANGGTIIVNSEDKTNKFLCLRAGDTVGHITYQAVGPFKIDNQAASVTIFDDAEGTYQTSDDIVFNIDYGPSGPGTTEYILTTDNVCDNSIDFSEAYNYTSGQTLTFDSENYNGLYICLRARDAKGDQNNEEFTYVLSGQLKIDTTNPEVTIDEVTTPTNQVTQTITGTYTEDHLESITVNGVTANINTVNNAYSASIDLSEGDNTITVVATDEAGNTDEATTYILLDTKAPIVDAGTDKIVNSEFVQDASASDLDSGIKFYSWTQVSGPGTVSFGSPNAQDTTVSADTEGTYIIRLTVTDNAGNSADSDAQFIWDKTAPGFTIEEGVDEGPVQTDTIRIAVSDDNGISESKYGFSADATCDSNDNYDNDFDLGVDFYINDDHTDYLCVMATDKAGNTGYELVGQLNVDKTAPVLNSVNIISSNTNHSLAKVGDIITLTFVANEDIQTPNVTIAGNVAAVVGFGATWTATYTMIDDDAEGIIPFTINFKDIAGNSGEQVSNTTDGSQVEFDKTAPIVTINSLLTNDTSPELTGTVNDNSAAIEVSINGSTYEADNNGDGTWTLADNTISPLSAGDYEVEVVVSATDLAGNIGYDSSTKELHIDTVAPTVTEVSPVSTPTRDQTPDYTFNTNEAGVISCANGCSCSGNAAVGENTVTFDELDEGVYSECTLMVTDEAGNTGYTDVSEFTIDITKPTIYNYDDIKKEATSPAGASVEFDPLAGDNYDDDVEVTCNYESGTVFPLGITIVNCWASDDAGNEESIDFKITIEDTTPPSISEHSDIEGVEATSPDGAVVTYEYPTASDTVDETLTVVCSPDSGFTFPIGNTEVTCTVEDDSGNESSTSFTVEVVDTTAPTITPPDTQTFEATGPMTSPELIWATASDVVDSNPSIDYTPKEFPVGENTVTWTAVDDYGNTSQATSLVIIKDTTPPTFSDHEDIIVEATSPDGAVVEYEYPTANDIVDGTVEVDCSKDSGDIFPLGETEVVCTAKDSSGNESSTSFIVRVEDTTAPEIISWSPQGEVGYLNPTISAQFSDIASDIDVSELNIQVVGGSINLDNSYFTINSSGIISNTSGIYLERNTTYTVTISGLKDSAGNITPTKTWSFTIANDATEVDTEAPTATQYPENGATGVSVEIQPYIEFSEPMDVDSLYNNVKLRRYNDSTAVEAEYEYTDTKVVIKPLARLDYNTTYYFYIDNDVRDANGNYIEEDSWYAAAKDSHKFTTEAEPETTCNEDHTSCTIQLNEGWNLISLPLIPNNADINEVLAGLSEEGSVDVVQYYDNESGEWLSYLADTGLGDLTTMEDGKGYWVYANQSTALTINGHETNNPPATPVNTYEVNNGWNLLGFKSTENMSVIDYTNNQIGDNDLMWGYKNNAYKLIYPVTSGGSNIMEPGFGYWLYVSGNGYTITPPTN